MLATIFGFLSTHFLSHMCLFTELSLGSRRLSKSKNKNPGNTCLPVFLFGCLVSVCVCVSACVEICTKLAIITPQLYSKPQGESADEAIAANCTSISFIFSSFSLIVFLLISRLMLTTCFSNLGPKGDWTRPRTLDLRSAESICWLEISWFSSRGYPNVREHTQDAITCFCLFVAVIQIFISISASQLVCLWSVFGRMPLNFVCLLWSSWLWCGFSFLIVLFFIRFTLSVFIRLHVVVVLFD